MGYMRHHAIVVTSGIEDLIKEAHAKARDLRCSISELVASPVNAYWSFLIAPDGSNEGWGESDVGDAQRKAWTGWARSKAYVDGSSSLGWVEVMYHDERKEVAIVSDGDEKRRGKPNG